MLEPIFSIFGSAEGAVDTTAPLGILIVGLLTGLRHSMDADHVAAVSTIVATSKRKLRQAPMLGLLWGVGHTATLLVAGLLVLLVAVKIPERLSGQMEFGVGIMLVFLAATTITGFKSGRFLRGVVRKRRHSHLHFHQDSVSHTHEHTHVASHHHSHKSLIIGMVHGMAGSGALMLVILTNIDSVPLGIAYIAIFGAGSIASMVGISTVIGLPFSKIRNLTKLTLALKYTTTAAALIIGADLMYELGIVEQVFQE